jgi:beta-N-acetylhexosaminidase
VKKRTQLILIILIAVLTVAANVIIFHQAGIILTKTKILASTDKNLELLGRHFIVGYDDFDMVKLLVEKGAIGGIFITSKNVGNKTTQEIRAEVDELQKIQNAHHRPPLIISTDQEGGLVARLTPPLQKLPTLASVIDENGNIQKEKLLEYADTQATELAEAGVNVNFAPVVDINEGLVNQNDNQTVIYKRAISDNPATVAEVASTYCKILKEHGVLCTLKHFPGLGRVTDDTHVSGATLDLSATILKNHELIPFEQNIPENPLIMLSHVILTSIDPDHPVSSSKKVVEDLIRGDLRFNGVLVTDDFSMGAITSSENAAIDALNAGVDLILISYNHDLYYPIMDKVLNAANSGVIKMDTIKTSGKRLDDLFPTNSFSP